MMVENNCGEIPIVDRTNHPIGVVTDRGSSAGSSPRVNPVQPHGRLVHEQTGRHGGW